jgi:hypothetical protein
MPKSKSKPKSYAWTTASLNTPISTSLSENGSDKRTRGTNIKAHEGNPTTTPDKAWWSAQARCQKATRAVNVRRKERTYLEQLAVSLEKELYQAKAFLKAEKNGQEEVEANLSKLKNLQWKLRDVEASKKALCNFFMNQTLQYI